MANGLLDFISTPEGQGLLSMAFGGLAGARRGAPLNSIGAAGLAGLSGYANAQERNDQLAQNKQMSELRGYQIQQAKQAADDQTAASDFMKQWRNQGTPAPVSQPSVPVTSVAFTPEYNAQRTASVPVQPAQAPQTDNSMSMIKAMLNSGNPLLMKQAEAMVNAVKLTQDEYGTEPRMMTDPTTGKLINVLVSKQGNIKPVGYGVASKMEIGPGGQAYNPYTIKENTVLADPNKPFSVGPDGKPLPNLPYQQFEINKSRAGATNVKIENKTGESLAGQVGPMVRETWNAANGAVQTANAANDVLKAVEGNKLYTGPGANMRLSVAQLGDTLGVGGKDTLEKIANTRQALTGLAQMTLQGRKQMTGQGAITESESKLAERAMSGDISMTASEIKQLANAAHRAAKFTYDQHQTQIGSMQQDPNLVGLSKFYKTAPFPSVYAPATSAAPVNANGAKFLGFE